MQSGSKINKRKRFLRDDYKCICSGTVVVEKCKDYCKKTSLHGLKYVENERLSKFERLFFMLAFLSALVLLLNFVSNVYIKWTRNPVIIGFSSVPVSIKKIPFPAVTICNMNLARVSIVKNITRGTAEFSMLQTLCEDNFEENGTASVTNFDDFDNFILKVSQPCDKMILSCKFGKVQDNCNQLFKPVLSNEGLCCSFNYGHETIMYKNGSGPLNFRSNIGNLTVINWTLQRGYPKDKLRNFYPQPAAGVGKTYGLNVILDIEANDYYCSSSYGTGLKVLLHNPNEAPNIAEFGVLVRPGYETQFVIEPDISDASPALSGLKKEQRRCLFNNESKLVYFGKYLTRNCEAEFEAQRLANKCNCIHYYMPRINPNITVCGIRDKPCYTQAHICQDGENCSSDCLPGCFELKFWASKTSSTIRRQNFAIRSKFVQSIPVEYASSNIAILHIYYIENAFRGKTKQQYVGITDFVANTGGLLGLFMGFSAISLVEIFYYVFCKPIIDQYRGGIERDFKNSKKYARIKGKSYKSNTWIYEDNISRNFKQTIGFDKSPKAIFTKKLPYYN